MLDKRKLFTVLKSGNVLSKIIFFGILVLQMSFINSCSVITKNTARETTLLIHGGQYDKSQWDDDLIFQRVSWYQEFNLLADVLWIKAPEGPFAAWFGKNELKEIESCPVFFIFIHYTNPYKKVSVGQIKSQITENGGKFVSLGHFSENLVQHPQFIENSLGVYKIEGLCMQNSDGVTVQIPGQQSKRILIE